MTLSEVGEIGAPGEVSPLAGSNERAGPWPVRPDA